MSRRVNALSALALLSGLLFFCLPSCRDQPAGGARRPEMENPPISIVARLVDDAVDGLSVRVVFSSHQPTGAVSCMAVGETPILIVNQADREFPFGPEMGYCLSQGGRFLISAGATREVLVTVPIGRSEDFRIGAEFRIEGEDVDGIVWSNWVRLQ